jgi:hypothetical protein
VQLEVGHGVLELRAGRERVVEVDVVLCGRVGQRYSVGVAPLAQLVLIRHRAGCGRGAEERATEPRTLLVRPAHEPHGQRRRPVFREAPHHLHACEDVEAAVEPPAVRHGVHVAADQERPLGLARQREPLVPRLVDLLRGAGRRHLLAQPLTRPLPRIRPRDALRPVLVAGQLLQLTQLRDRAFR